MTETPLSRSSARVVEALQSVRERDRMKSRAYALQIALAAAAERERALEKRLAAEESDVRTLEGLSVTALFLALVGRKGERLEVERREALLARLRLDAAREETTALRQEALDIRRRLEPLGDVDAKLEAAYADKEAQIASSDPALRERLVSMDDALAQGRAIAKEVGEAEEAARRAVSALRLVVDHTERARRLGVWDMVGGGSIATWMKHSALDSARSAASNANYALSALQRELRDVEGMTPSAPGLAFGEFARFADWFFDGLFVDWHVQGRITASLDNAQSALSQTERIATRLRERGDALRKELAATEAERRSILERS